MRLPLAVTLCLGVTAATLPRPFFAQVAPTPTPIAKRAIATLTIPGSADFLVAEGNAVWATNEGRVEKLLHDHPGPVVSIAVPAPCGAMSVAFRSLWVANCSDSSVYRIDLKTAKLAAIIRTGLADPSGELSLAAGAGSVWTLTDPQGILSRIDPATNRVVALLAFTARRRAQGPAS